MSHIKRFLNEESGPVELFGLLPLSACLKEFGLAREAEVDGLSEILVRMKDVESKKILVSRTI